MEAMKMVVLCASNTQGTRTTDCHDANQTLILQIVVFRQPREPNGHAQTTHATTVQPTFHNVSLKNRFQKVFVTFQAGTDHNCKIKNNNTG
jgi:hypothetical protein